MAPKASNSGHLIRLAGVVVVFLIGFVFLRRALVPPDFGQLGHYRSAALEENRTRVASFAGQAKCVLCHEIEDKDRQSGRHARVACEACHGAAAGHVNDPSQKPTKLNVIALCVNCHAKDAAKPAAFPQIVAAQHNTDAGACINCHQPHRPKM